MVDADDANWIKKMQSRFSDQRKQKTSEFETKIQDQLTWFAQQRQAAMESCEESENIQNNTESPTPVEENTITKEPAALKDPVLPPIDNQDAKPKTRTSKRQKKPVQEMKEDDPPVEAPPVVQAPVVAALDPNNMKCVELIAALRARKMKYNKLKKKTMVKMLTKALKEEAEQAAAEAEDEEENSMDVIVPEESTQPSTLPTNDNEVVVVVPEEAEAQHQEEAKLLEERAAKLQAEELLRQKKLEAEKEEEERKEKALAEEKRLQKLKEEEDLRLKAEEARLQKLKAEEEERLRKLKLEEERQMRLELERLKLEKENAERLLLEEQARLEEQLKLEERLKKDAALKTLEEKKRKAEHELMLLEESTSKELSIKRKQPKLEHHHPTEVAEPQASTSSSEEAKRSAVLEEAKKMRDYAKSIIQKKKANATKHTSDAKEASQSEKTPKAGGGVSKTIPSSDNKPPRKLNNLVAGVHSFASLSKSAEKEAVPKPASRQLNSLKLAEKSRLAEEKRAEEREQRKELLRQKYAAMQKKNPSHGSKPKIPARITTAVTATTAGAVDKKTEGGQKRTSLHDRKPGTVSKPGKPLSNQRPVVAGKKHLLHSTKPIKVVSTHSLHSTGKVMQPTAKKPLEEQSYQISDKEGSSSDDSEDESAKSKIPRWARKEQLAETLKMQFTKCLDPSPSIFPEFPPTIDLEKIFQPKDLKTKSKYSRRNSSSAWQNHKATKEDLEKYNRDMGYSK